MFGSLQFFWAALTGIITTLVIGEVTNYYTAANKSPVKQIAQASTTGAGTNIIIGIAKGMESTVMPMLVICAAILVSYYVGGVYGISVAALAMLSMTGIIVAVDSFGPITDNAGGIAEMAGMPEKVRKTVTDPLDAVGNTTKADTRLTTINLLKPTVVVGLFIGAMLPFIFSSLTMRAVGKAAYLIVEEVRRQFREIPGLMKGKAKPDYTKCVDISTKAAIKELILPGILAVFTPLVVGFVFGAEALGGLLAVAIITGVLLAITMTTTGAAWDNAKKFIEMGNLGGKGSDAHKAAVVGDTVGDAFKDTSGPALNPLIKVLNTISLLAASGIVTYALM